MSRFLSGLAWVLFLSSVALTAWEAPARHRQREDKIAVHVTRDKAASVIDGKYTLAEDADVRLDDRPVRYEDVPKEGVEIVRLTAEGKTITAIHFRTKAKARPGP